MKRILIAEDDPVSSLVLKTNLEKLGHEVVTAADGRDAWFSYLHDRPRIIITDWMMPIIDGLELCRRIRAEKRTQYVYIIVLTALAGKNNFLEGMEAGADDFITKPFDSDSLAARLKVAERVLSLQTEVSQLEGLLPICSYCKRIRNEDNAWQQVERYVGQKTEAAFAQTLCPDCLTEQGA